MNETYCIPRRRSRFDLSIIWILAFFGATFFVYFDFGIRMILGYGFLMISVVLYCLKKSRIILTREKCLYLFFTLMISAFIFLGNSNEGSIEFAIGMDLCALIAVAYIPDERQYVNAMKLLFFFSVAFCLYSILVFVFPDLYSTIVKPRISEESIRYNAELLRDGYGVALGANIAYIDYIAAIGVILSASCLMNGYTVFKSHKLLYLGLIIGVMGMLCVNRKGEILGLIIAVLLLYRLHIKRSNRTIKKKTKTLAVRIILVGTVAIVYLASKGYLLRFYLFFNKIVRNLTNDTVDMTSGRLVIWKYALRLYPQKPLLGIGWEQFRANVPALEIDTVKVHNNFIQVLLETGLIGLVLIMTPKIVLMILSYAEMKKYYRRNGCNKIVKVAYMLSVGLQVYYFILDFIDPSIYKMHFWPIYTIAIMSLIFARHYDRQDVAAVNYVFTGLKNRGHFV